MRPWIAFLLLGLLAAALPASAQPPTFSQAYQVRGAVGDIATTAATEPAGAWNLEQRLSVHFDNHTAASHAFNIPDGARLVNATCTCNPAHFTSSAGSVVFTIDSGVPSGTYVLTVLTSQPSGLSFGFTIRVPVDVGASDRLAILYVPATSMYDAPVKASSTPGLSTDGSARIQEFDGFPDTFWVAIHPTGATAVSAPTVPLATWPIALAIGAVAGAVLWAVLVSQGVVQRKGRRQVAATAAHVEAAANEPAAVLEGRKRALLAALKEIEVAKMNGEMPNEVYDVVKADLKRQAVTVMRALESSAGGEGKAS